jgi:NAD(P)-dependent dehydrogenase (short-subunit alcohol dehydrogenase family)
MEGRATVALVTGANKGIGYAIVRQLAKKDPTSRVLLGSRNTHLGEEALKKLEDEGLNNVRLLQIDLDNEESIRAAAQTIKETYGGLDILINNAGMAWKGNAFNEEVANTTIGTNYYGTLKVCQHMLPLIHDYGRVVNVSSRAGLLRRLPSEELRNRFLDENLTLESLSALVEEFKQAVKDDKVEERGWAKQAYGTSKAAVTALTRVLAKIEAQNTQREGVLINACCPGWCKTDMSSNSGNKTADEGAEVAVFLATLPRDSTATGKFWGENQEISVV